MASPGDFPSSPFPFPAKSFKLAKTWEYFDELGSETGVDEEEGGDGGEFPGVLEVAFIWEVMSKALPAEPEVTLEEVDDDVKV